LLFLGNTTLFGGISVRAQILAQPAVSPTHFEEKNPFPRQTYTRARKAIATEGLQELIAISRGLELKDPRSMFDLVLPIQ
jgi:hypothetical protein